MHEDTITTTISAALAAVDIADIAERRRTATDRIAEIEAAQRRADAELTEARRRVATPVDPVASAGRAASAYLAGDAETVALDDTASRQADVDRIAVVLRGLNGKLADARAAKDRTRQEACSRLAAAVDPLADALEAALERPIAEVLAIWADARAAGDAAGNVRLQLLGERLDAVAAELASKGLAGLEFSPSAELVNAFDLAAQALELAGRRLPARIAIRPSASSGSFQAGVRAGFGLAQQNAAPTS